MALSAVKSTLERALDKDLSDLVRGIRAHKDDEAKYIHDCIDEIKNELKSGSIAAKANATNKLAYLQMLGYDISWAAFNIIEVMSSPKFSFKRIGYLAASQSFGEHTDVLMLTTNLIRKDLNSGKLYDTSVALSGLSCFVTPDLARDLCDDVLALTMSPKPYIAKKAVLLLYKIFLKNPDALRTAFPRLRKKLEDPDPGVQSAAVNVICELARKNPQNYLSLSPVFFKLMTSSTNNWVLIKIIKLFGALTPLEPRLGKKLIEPLTNLIHNTSAMSLLYECINTVLAGVPDHHASIQLCVQKLRILIEDSDQNLKYLGLLAMNKILRHHPKSVQAHKDLILACLEDKDESIRLRALDLLHGMVTKTNLIEIVKSLVRHLNSPDIGNYFRSELISTIVRICSQENYHYVVSFEWYVSVLIELAQLNTNRTGELLANQLLDVAVRVASVRQFAVGQMAIFLRSCKSMMTHSNQASLHDVIYAAAWICGEYAGFLEEPRETLEAMLETASFIDLPGHIQSVLVLNCLKLYCKLVAAWFAQTTGGCDVLSDPPPPPPESIDASADLRALVDRLLELTAFLMDKISLFVHSANLEAQERAVSIHQLLHLVVKRLTKLRATASTSPLPQPPPPPPTSTCGGGGGGGGDEDVVDLLGIDADDSLDPLSAVRKTASAADDAPTPATDSTQPPPSSDLLNGVHGVLVELGGLFAGEVHPVAAKAQRKVPLPEGLDLDAWINEPPPPPKLTLASPSSLLPTDAPLDRHKKRSKKGVIGESATGGIFSGLVEPEGPKPVKLTQAELDEMRKQRLLLQESNPHYLKSTKKRSQGSVSEEPEAPPVVEAPSTDVPKTPKLASSDKFAMEMQKQLKEIGRQKAKTPTGTRGKARKGQRPRKERVPVPEESEEAVDFPTSVPVSTVVDLPEGVTPNDVDSPDEESELDPNDPHRLLNIQLDIPSMEEATLDTPSRPSTDTKKTLQTRNKKKKASKVNGTSGVGGAQARKEPSRRHVQSNDQRGEIKQPRSDQPPVISEEAFVDLLSNFKAVTAARAKVRCPATAEALSAGNSHLLEPTFVSLLGALSKAASLSVVERVGTSASVYAEVATTPVCVLIKLSTSTGSVSIEAKSEDETASTDLVQRVKTLVKGFRPAE